MRIEKVSDASFILRGKINEFSDYQDIKNLLEKRRSGGVEEALGKEVSFKITQAQSIMPHVLGYLLKLVREDDFKIQLEVQNKFLYETLYRVGLDLFFEVKLELEYNI